MTDDPVDLDNHRTNLDQKETEIRRQSLRHRLDEFQTEVAEFRLRRDDIEDLFLTAMADTWPEAAAKAQYLINLFAATPEAQNERSKELIADALNDLIRLSDRANKKL
jgi:hypothetical protein